MFDNPLALGLRVNLMAKTSNNWCAFGHIKDIVILRSHKKLFCNLVWVISYHCSFRFMESTRCALKLKRIFSQTQKRPILIKTSFSSGPCNKWFCLRLAVINGNELYKKGSAINMIALLTTWFTTNRELYCFVVFFLYGTRHVHTNNFLNKYCFW